ncbi:Protein N-acetyltransferase, RimJ/RimL family [Sphingomonas laterariae]|uniref:Protein N-acetyltransferase, RimJ/RimL family n=1 Tax=Edaphosphingomonas laterariae TaxID=861865 RepID=A0A239EPT7_9SPHN|nr:GNAT family N-acetyltransferase [Sphingomonas laterariae]SNS45874.1 Protein N-acetyltransferase, RimJ/RimL family [Sphingomonas laterariae]
MFARTERLLLRPAWEEDDAALHAAIGDEVVVRNLARVPWPYRMEDARSYIGMARDPQLPDFLIFARTHGAPRLIGGIGLQREDSGAIELGYWIARPYWGLGFATEAARAVIGMADDSLRIAELVAGHFLDNPASANVLYKLGFQPTGEVVMRRSVARGRDVACARFTRQAGAQGEPVNPALAA